MRGTLIGENQRCLSELALVLLVLEEEVVVDVDAVLVGELVVGRVVMPEVLTRSRLRVGPVFVRSCAAALLLGQSLGFRLARRRVEDVQDSDLLTVDRLRCLEAVDFGEGTALDLQVLGRLCRRRERAVTLL